MKKLLQKMRSTKIKGYRVVIGSIFIALYICCYCWLFDERRCCYPRDDDWQYHLEYKKFKKIAKKEFDLRLDDTRFDNGHSFAMYFEGKRPVSVEEGRELFFKVMDRFVDDVNKNEKLYQHVIEKPLTNKNVWITLYFDGDKDLSQNRIIEVIRGREGKIIYRSYDENEQGYKDIYSESFEEGKHLVQ